MRKAPPEPCPGWKRLPLKIRTAFYYFTPNLVPSEVAGMGGMDNSKKS